MEEQTEDISPPSGLAVLSPDAGSTALLKLLLCMKLRRGHSHAHCWSHPVHPATTRLSRPEASPDETTFLIPMSHFFPAFHLWLFWLSIAIFSSCPLELLEFCYF